MGRRRQHPPNPAPVRTGLPGSHYRATAARSAGARMHYPVFWPVRSSTHTCMQAHARMHYPVFWPFFSSEHAKLYPLTKMVWAYASRLILGSVVRVQHRYVGSTHARRVCSFATSARRARVSLSPRAACGMQELARAPLRPFIYTAAPPPGGDGGASAHVCTYASSRLRAAGASVRYTRFHD